MNRNIIDLGSILYTPEDDIANDFLLKLQKFCNQHGILVIVDEVQSGMGRTGKMFAWQHVDGFQPDAMTLAKALGSGFPISALLGKPAIMSQWKKGAHGSTFGGNPVACAAALATLDVIEDEKDRIKIIDLLDGFYQVAFQPDGTIMELDNLSNPTVITAQKAQEILQAGISGLENRIEQDKNQ